MLFITLKPWNREFNIAVEDNEAAQKIATFFSAEYLREPPRKTDALILGCPPSSISSADYSMDGLVPQECLWHLTLLLGKHIRSEATEGILSVHASSCTFEGDGIMFIGTSGSGKTTLAATMAKDNAYIGDEYAFLELRSLELFHAKYPIQFKPETLKANPELLNYDNLPLKSDLFDRSYLFRAEDIFSNFVKPRQKIPLTNIVFPHFSPEIESTIITPAKASDYPKLILTSFCGALDNGQLFRTVIEQFARHGIKMWSVDFSNAQSASEELSIEFASQ